MKRNQVGIIALGTVLMLAVAHGAECANAYDYLTSGNNFYQQYVVSQDKALLEKAYINYYKASEIEPSSSSFLGMGMVLLEKKQYAKAKEFLYRAYSIDERDATTNYYLGRFSFEKQDYLRALEFYNNAYNYGMSGSYDVNATLGTIYAKVGDIEKAKKFYIAALGLNPTNEALQKRIEELQQIDAKSKSYGVEKPKAYEFDFDINAQEDAEETKVLKISEPDNQKVEQNVIKYNDVQPQSEIKQKMELIQSKSTDSVKNIQERVQEKLQSASDKIQAVPAKVQSAGAKLENAQNNKNIEQSKNPPTIKIVPTVKNMPAVKNTPTVKSTPAAKSTQAVKNTPTVKSVPTGQNTSTVNKAPAVKSAPATQSTSAVKNTSTVKSTSVVKNASTLESKPAVKNASATKATPAANSTSTVPNTQNKQSTQSTNKNNQNTSNSSSTKNLQNSQAGQSNQSSQNNESYRTIRFIPF